MKLVILEAQTFNFDPSPNPWAPLAALGELTIYPDSTPAQVLERAAEADIVITNKVRLSAEIIQALPALRCIGVLATGVDVVDLQAAQALNIPVINVVGYGVESVAEHTLALMLGLARQAGLHDQSIKAGQWAHEAWCYWKTPQIELHNKTLGLLGYGQIAHRVGQLGQALGMRVIAHSRSRQPGSQNSQNDQNNVEFVTLDQLFQQSQVLSLHCPLNENSRQIVNAKRLSSMPHGALLINTARGALLDDQAVAAALKSGQLAGLGADVLSQEPPAADHPLLHAPNTLLTPHLAWASLPARQNIVRILAENLQAWIIRENGKT